jgi:Holliday junction resolvase-like predicted endonuclease
VATIKLQKKKAHQRYKTVAGKVVPGGSTICKIGEPADGLFKWHYRLGAEGLDPDAVMSEASGIGTVAHFMIQCSFTGDVGDFSEFSEVEVNAGQLVYEKFVKVWREQGLEFVASELQLISEEHQYGGTLDIVAKKNGQLVLVDVKSSPQIRGSMYRQLAGYENLWNENNSAKIEQRVIFRLDKVDPEKTDIRWLGNMDKHLDIFLAQLKLYYAFKALNA